MDAKKISDTFSVSRQIMLAKIGQIEATGRASIRGNRTDGEDGEQRSFEEIADVADNAGVKQHYIPIMPDSMSDPDIFSIGRALGYNLSTALAPVAKGGISVCWESHPHYLMIVGGGPVGIVERKYDMVHLMPPQSAVDQRTIRPAECQNIYSLGYVMNAPNAKTAAAARKQVSTAAENVLEDMGKLKSSQRAVYDGYGSCPLMVARSKIAFSEFSYGGKNVLNSPPAQTDDLNLSCSASLQKKKMLPPGYWHAKLKERDPFAKPVHAT